MASSEELCMPLTPDKTVQETTQDYTNFSNKYDDVMHKVKFTGHIKVAQLASDLIKDKNGAKVLDLACGTGLTGETLREQGFTHVDGVDASPGMLEVAHKKGVYTKTFMEFIGGEYPPLPIEDGTYDVIAIAGGMAQNLIPCSALHEMIRVTKSGGYIVNVFREEVLNDIEEYKDRLEPLYKSLEKEGKLKLITRELHPTYLIDKTGIVFVHQVC